MNDTNQNDPAAVSASPPGDRSNPNSTLESENESAVDPLLTQVSLLYNKSKCKEGELLAERIEIGSLLLRLKEKVGHGNFLKQFKEWIESGKVDFSYATANRAMSYAELDSEGKLSTVQNLADAEKVRRALKEGESKKAKANTAETEDVADEGPAEALDQIQVKTKAWQIAKPTLEECHGFESKTRELLLEELIEIFTEELNKCE